MILRDFSSKEKIILAVLSLSLILITLTTNYYGSTDIGDYGDVAKFFSGNYKADIRSSHSYLWGFVHAPFTIVESLILLKISSLIFLSFIILSTYIVSGKDKKSLFLILVSPVVWYMGPWINPVQIASLCLLWSYFFIKKYNSESKIQWLIYSAVLIGVGWGFWDTILYFGAILGFFFLIDKKLYKFLIFISFVFIGLFPRMILDQFLFNFPLQTTIKTFVSGFVNIFGGIYSSVGHTPKTITNIILVLITLPILLWILFFPKHFKDSPRDLLFIAFSLLLIMTNPQIRYTLALVPISIILVSKHLNTKNFRIQVVIYVLVSLIFIAPYIIQIDRERMPAPYGYEISSLGNSNNDLTVTEIEEFLNNLEEIDATKYVVGNTPDDYQTLAHYYWGDKVESFVSIQDYDLWLENKTILYSKRFEPVPNIPDRRSIWFEGGISGNKRSDAFYEEIEYGIGLGGPVSIKGFKLISQKNGIYLSKKE